MILTGRWAYKKYKKRKADKEELNETAHAKHSDLFVATQAEIENTAVEHLGNASPKPQRSDLPPSYSKIEKDLLKSPTSGLHPSSSVKSTTSSLGTLEQEASASYLSQAQLSSATDNRISGHVSQVAPTPSEMTVGQPTEIQVHGRWVWIPDGGPLPSTPVVQLAPSSVVDEDDAAAELPAARPPEELPSTSNSMRTSEEDQKGGFVIAELDSKPISAGDSDKEVCATR
ncbi:hypothetical protein H2200_000752 [Cladophialophora chaetospira]|uniref:Uncharacterized protein n=1 Tax=Cladophialophora chaetospira TaxID=386627 RepID=A0AA38XPW6_9EURO|nr:hypothetical protein H2200_000752 [Cladophialophora chaetospira]